MFSLIHVCMPCHDWACWLDKWGLHGCCEKFGLRWYLVWNAYILLECMMMMKWNFECVKEDLVTPPWMLLNRGKSTRNLFCQLWRFWSKLSSLLKDSITIFPSQWSQRSSSCRPSLATLHGECGFHCPTKHINGISWL